MEAALGLARRGLGRVWPNPAVGCVLVRDGRVVGRGWTQPGGRPHAETEALRRAGAAARGATAYVTLEPCAHFGRTPPCAQALIDAGVARVVCALVDPDPRVAGRGLSMLRDSGIVTDSGLLEAEAAEVNAGFLLRLSRARPLVTLKTATSLDGRIATASGESQWITGPEARREGHRLRACNDAILIGVETALNDAPSLTCRLPGLEGCSPVRVVLDSRARLPLDHPLVLSAGDVPTWVVTVRGAAGAQALRAAGVAVLEVAAADGGVDLAATLRELAARGITRLLIEGGGRVAAGFLARGLVDRLYWFTAPMLLGGDARAAVSGLGLDRLADSPLFTWISSTPLGHDRVDAFTRRPAAQS